MNFGSAGGLNRKTQIISVVHNFCFSFPLFSSKVEDANQSSSGHAYDTVRSLYPFRDVCSAKLGLAKLQR